MSSRRAVAASRELAARVCDALTISTVNPRLYAFKHKFQMAALVFFGTTSFTVAFTVIAYNNCSEECTMTPLSHTQTFNTCTPSFLRRHTRDLAEDLQVALSTITPFDLTFDYYGGSAESDKTNPLCGVEDCVDDLPKVVGFVGKRVRADTIALAEERFDFTQPVLMVNALATAVAAPSGSCYSTSRQSGSFNAQLRDECVLKELEAAPFVLVDGVSEIVDLVDHPDWENRYLSVEFKVSAYSYEVRPRQLTWVYKIAEREGVIYEFVSNYVYVDVDSVYILNDRTCARDGVTGVGMCFGGQTSVVTYPNVAAVATNCVNEDFFPLDEYSQPKLASNFSSVKCADVNSFPARRYMMASSVLMHPAATREIIASRSSFSVFCCRDVCPSLALSFGAALGAAQFVDIALVIVLTVLYSIFVAKPLEPPENVRVLSVKLRNG